jgi:Flp pilus assembly protein TadD
MVKSLFYIGVLWLPLLASDLELARDLYNRTEYQAAIALLRNSPERRSAEAQEILGKSWYQTGDFKKAVEAFESVERLRPADARIKNWLGRSWGRRAETSNPLMAPGYAAKARRYFEEAVRLNPRDLEAVDDLFSYYLEAPGFLGGGLDKAAALAEQIKTNDPAEYHFALAQIAERRKQYDLAEGQLRKAVELAPKQVGRILDLARFLARRGKLSDAEQAFQQARAADPKNRQVLYAQAEVYIQSGRDFARARQLLKEYLDGPLTPEDPSREEARRLLQRVSN